MRILEEVGLTFDDALMVPRLSEIGSRYSGEIDISTELFPIYANHDHVPGSLRYPIISANMDSVTESQMALAMSDLGGLGIIHRFCNVEQHCKELAGLNFRQVACIGVANNDLDRLEALRPHFSAVLIDIAHGHCRAMIDQIHAVKKMYPDMPIIAGNVATKQGVVDLITAGADCIKVGVGCGSLCSTRINTGCGVPQLTAIVWAKEVTSSVNRPVTIIADGGIRNSGDIMKAIAAGADAVMVGSLFAGTEEAPGRIRTENGILYKVYRGMASREAQEDWKGFAKSIEGESTRVPYKGKAEAIFSDLTSSMLSSMSYMNARNIQELRENTLFIRQTVAGLRESLPHGLLK